ncbi:hypothetical protein GDO81_014256 [Engystomops pustulosus]|uniref:Uncharacterized protein n=1 Tax=Engystomops pustulosus TaxID=76066 RepID=A0AAV7B974_ENGPU|nr:hypothetical protein GDO81_014256 [Engystomops pustulosus]
MVTTYLHVSHYILQHRALLAYARRTIMKTGQKDIENHSNKQQQVPIYIQGLHRNCQSGMKVLLRVIVKNNMWYNQVYRAAASPDVTSDRSQTRQ